MYQINPDFPEIMNGLMVSKITSLIATHPDKPYVELHRQVKYNEEFTQDDINQARIAVTEAHKDKGLAPDDFVFKTKTAYYIDYMQLEPWTRDVAKMQWKESVAQIY